MSACAICANPLPPRVPGRPGRPPTTCSDACRAEARERSRLASWLRGEAKEWRISAVALQSTGANLEYRLRFAEDLEAAAREAAAGHPTPYTHVSEYNRQKKERHTDD
ncbi:MAG: hypothetical protein DLM71_06455 [Chloroflexi bacterium]|nr:MAG: hypothetical protein DLM71_06455 [Chloroflexota bacterium]